MSIDAGLAKERKAFLKRINRPIVNCTIQKHISNRFPAEAARLSEWLEDLKKGCPAADHTKEIKSWLTKCTLFEQALNDADNLVHEENIAPMLRGIVHIDIGLHEAIEAREHILHDLQTQTKAAIKQFSGKIKPTEAAMLDKCRRDLIRNSPSPKSPERLIGWLDRCVSFRKELFQKNLGLHQ